MSTKKNLAFGGDGIENIDSNRGERDLASMDKGGGNDLGNNKSKVGERSIRWNVPGTDALSKLGRGHESDGPSSKNSTTGMSTPQLRVRSDSGTPGQHRGNHTTKDRFSRSNTNDAIASYYFEGMPYTPFSTSKKKEKKKKNAKSKGRNHASLGARDQLTPGQKKGVRLEEIMDQDDNDHVQEDYCGDRKHNNIRSDPIADNESLLENTFTLGNTADIASIYAMSTDPNATGIYTTEGSDDESMGRTSIGNPADDSNNLSNVSSEVEDALNATTLSDPHELSTSNFILGTKARNLLKEDKLRKAASGGKDDVASRYETFERKIVAGEDQAKERESLSEASQDLEIEKVVDGQQGENDNDDVEISKIDREEHLPLSSPTETSFLNGSSHDAAAVVRKMSNVTHVSSSLSTSESIAKKSLFDTPSTKGEDERNSSFTSEAKATKNRGNNENHHIKSPFPESPNESSIMNESNNDTSLIMKELNELMFSGESDNNLNTHRATPENDGNENPTLDGEILEFTSQLKSSRKKKETKEETKDIVEKPSKDADEVRVASLDATVEEIHDNNEEANSGHKTNEATPASSETIAATANLTKSESEEIVNKSISGVYPSPFFNSGKKQQPSGRIRNSFGGDVSKIRKLTASIRKEKEALRAKRARMSLPISVSGPGQKKGSALQRGRFSSIGLGAPAASIMESDRNDELVKKHVHEMKGYVTCQSNEEILNCRDSASMKELEDNKCSKAERETNTSQEKSSPAECDFPFKVDKKRNYSQTPPSFSMADPPARNTRSSEQSSLPITPPKKSPAKSPNKSLESISIDLNSPASNTRGAKAQLSPLKVNSPAKNKGTSTKLTSFASPSPSRQARHSPIPSFDSSERNPRRSMNSNQSDLPGKNAGNSASKTLQESTSDMFAFNLLTDSNLESLQQTTLPEHSERRKPVLGLNTTGSLSLEPESDDGTPRAPGECFPYEPSTTFTSLSSTSLSKEYPFLKIGSEDKSAYNKFTSSKSSPVTATGKAVSVLRRSETSSTLPDPGMETLMLSDLMEELEKENLPKDSKDDNSEETSVGKRPAKRRRDTADSALLSSLLDEVENSEKRATKGTSSPTTHEAARTPKSSSHKRLKSILNSSHKKDGKHRVARRIVAFGSPEAAEYNVGSPSVSMTPMHPKSVKEKYRVPTPVDDMEDEDRIEQSFSPSSHIMSNNSKQDSPRAEETAELEADLSGFLMQHRNSSMMASIDESVIERAERSSRGEETAQLEGDLSALISSTKKNCRETREVCEHSVSFEETAELEGGLSVSLGERSDKQLTLSVDESLQDNRDDSTANFTNAEETVELEKNITGLIAGAAESCPPYPSISDRRPDITMDETTELEGDMTRLIAQGSDPSLMEPIDESRIENAPELESEDTLNAVHRTQADESNMNRNDQFHIVEGTVELETNISTLFEGNIDDEQNDEKRCSLQSMTRDPLNHHQADMSDSFAFEMVSPLTSPGKMVKKNEKNSVGSSAQDQHTIELEVNISSLMKGSGMPPGAKKTIQLDESMVSYLSPKGRQSDASCMSEDSSRGESNRKTPAPLESDASQDESNTVPLDTNLGDLIVSQMDNLSEKADESSWSNLAEESTDPHNRTVVGDSPPAETVALDVNVGSPLEDAGGFRESQNSVKCPVDVILPNITTGHDVTTNPPSWILREEDKEISVERVGAPILSPHRSEILPNAPNLSKVKSVEGNEQSLTCADVSVSDQNTVELEGNISFLLGSLGTAHEEVKTIQIDGAMTSLLLNNGITCHGADRSEGASLGESNPKTHATSKTATSLDKSHTIQFDSNLGDLIASQFDDLSENADESSRSNLVEDSQRTDRRAVFGHSPPADKVKGNVEDAGFSESQNSKHSQADNFYPRNMNGNDGTGKLLSPQKQQYSLIDSSHRNAHSTSSHESKASGISYLRLSKSDDTVSELGMHTSNEFSKTSSELSEPIAEKSLEPVDMELNEILQQGSIDVTQIFRSECDAFLNALGISAECRNALVKGESESLILQICEDIERQMDECRSNVERKYVHFADVNEDLLRTLQRIIRADHRDGYAYQIYSQVKSGLQTSCNEAIGHMRQWLRQVTSIYNETLSISMLPDLEQENKILLDKYNTICNLQKQIATAKKKRTRRSRKKIVERQRRSIFCCEKEILELESQVQNAEKNIETLNRSTKALHQIMESSHQFEALVKEEKKCSQSADTSYFKFFAVEKLHNWVLAGSTESAFGLIFRGSLDKTSLLISFTIAESSKVSFNANRDQLPTSTHSFFSDNALKNKTTHPAVTDFVSKKMDLLCKDLKRIKISSPKHIPHFIHFIELKKSRIDAASKELGHALDQCNSAYLQQSKIAEDAYDFTTYITDPSAVESRLQVTLSIPDCYPFAPVAQELHPMKSSPSNISITNQLIGRCNPAFGVLSRTVKSLSQKFNNNL